MPIMFPAPGLFSMKKAWPSALEKCWPSTRATMSVPPPGGEGTTIRTGLAGYSCANTTVTRQQRSALTHRTEILHALGSHQNESHHARLGPAVHPVVNGAALHEHVARAQVN